MIFWTLVLIGVTVIIAKACDKFEESADFLGRNLPPGIKGSTINAIGSSMPELWTTMALLFIGGTGAFAAGISVTAGSAVFNSNVIPMLVIFAVTSVYMIRLFKLLSIGVGALHNEIKIDKKALIRDVVALLIAEIGLILLLSKSALTWVDGLILMGLYLPYAGYMWWETRNYEADGLIEMSYSDSDGTVCGQVKLPESLIPRKLKSHTKIHWKQLGFATLVLVGACYVLGESVMHTASLLGVHPMITALFLGAAASSVPDTILSIKDAMKGNYEDAIGNAVGSNTFDICVALGLPLFLFTLSGPLEMPQHDAVQVLRIGLLVFTVLIVALLLFPTVIRKWQGYCLAALYVLWSIFVLNTEFGWF